MSESAIAWPEKTRELRTAVLESTRWNAIRLRERDLVVDTWSKSGTTWVLQIVAQVAFGAPDGFDTRSATWPEFTLVPYEPMMAEVAAQRDGWRFFKTHLPVEALGIDRRVKYIYIGRDARDVVWSAYNHQAGFTQESLDAINGLPGRVGPPLTYPPGGVRDSYLYFLDHGALPGFPMAHYWSHVQGWWEVRDLPNVLLLHFNHLKADMGGQIRRIARFLGVEIDEAKWLAILEHCSFDYMREIAGASEQLKGVFKEGGFTFFHKGTNGRWKDVLSAEEAARCDTVAAANLTPDCARWLATGELAGS
jgi:aryl sulfotransferase